MAWPRAASPATTSLIRKFSGQKYWLRTRILTGREPEFSRGAILLQGSATIAARHAHPDHRRRRLHRLRPGAPAARARRPGHRPRQPQRILRRAAEGSAPRAACGAVAFRLRAARYHGPRGDDGPVPAAPLRYRCPSRRAGRSALFDRESAGLRRRESRRLRQRARRLPPRRRTAPGLRFLVIGLWRQQAAAFFGEGQRRSSGFAVRRHQEGERADGARVRPSLQPALHRLAVFHGVPAVGPPGHGAVQIYARHPGRCAAAGVQPRPHGARFHLYRRHRRRRAARRRPPGGARPAVERRAPRQRALERALVHLQHRQSPPRPAPPLHPDPRGVPRPQSDPRLAAAPARRRAGDLCRHFRARRRHGLYSRDADRKRRAPLRRLVPGLLQMKVAIIGLGYVGLPLATAFGAVCPTVGYDRDERKIARLKERRDATGEVSAEEFAAARELQVTHDPAALREADFLIIAVPTPVDGARRPDLALLLSASETAGRHMKRGATVIVESTVYPGCTEADCVPALDRASGLRWRQDFHVGYSPERINPGDKAHRLASIVKVVSGDSPETLERVARVYQQVAL